MQHRQPSVAGVAWAWGVWGITVYGRPQGWAYSWTLSPSRGHRVVMSEPLPQPVQKRPVLAVSLMTFRRKLFLTHRDATSVSRTFVCRTLI